LAIDRRTFLVGATSSALVASGIGGGLFVAGARRRSVRGWVERLLEVPGAHDVGLEYLTRNPDEATEDELATRLSGVVPIFGALHGENESAAAFHDAVRRDFVDGHVERFGGWMLARTELRLYALAAIRAQAASSAQGLFLPQIDTDGQRFNWTAPTAALRVPTDVPMLTLRVRSGSPVPQRVTINMDGTRVDELQLSDPIWRPAQYLMPKKRPTLLLEFDTTPPWNPEGDFRTIGVGIDRTWDPST
jgi:hypothetical protein